MPSIPPPSKIKQPKVKPATKLTTALIGTNAYRFGGQRICSDIQVRTDLLEVAAWTEVRALMENLQRLEQEYHRRQQQPTNAKQLNLAINPATIGNAV